MYDDVREGCVMDSMRIVDNVFRIEFEPFNEIEDFAEFCCRLLELDSEQLEISFSDKVFFLGSQYIGVLMMTAAGAKMQGKKLQIS